MCARWEQGRKLGATYDWDLGSQITRGSLVASPTTWPCSTTSWKRRCGSLGGGGLMSSNSWRRRPGYRPRLRRSDILRVRRSASIRRVACCFCTLKVVASDQGTESRSISSPLLRQRPVSSLRSRSQARARPRWRSTAPWFRTLRWRAQQRRCRRGGERVCGSASGPLGPSSASTRPHLRSWQRRNPTRDKTAATTRPCRRPAYCRARRWHMCPPRHRRR
mmetsp:Transcript_9901/g.23331  ORF Transcript_9901/g.23331 Transcript_9901/m.23331 type:complete len:220 (-) Transcript_9901:708-1367(-)